MQLFCKNGIVIATHDDSQNVAASLYGEGTFILSFSGQLTSLVRYGNLPVNWVEGMLDLRPFAAPTLVNGLVVIPTDAILLANAQASQATLLSNACAAQIIGGYSSNALGTAHTYPSTQTDQANMIASVTSSLLPNLPTDWNTPFWCEDSNNVWAMINHTALQIQQVGSDGKNFIASCQQKYFNLLTSVQEATTITAVQAIIW